MNWILIIGIITAMYMAFNIAANDIGNSMGTAVGSGALTMRKALMLGALFEFLGALFLGSTVIKTVGSGIVPLEFMTGLGAFIITVSAGIWITITILKKIPISGSDAIVSSVIGYGLVYAGFNHLQWTTIGYIMASWVVSPLIGLASGYLAYYVLKRGYLNKIENNIGAKDRVRKVIFLLSNWKFILCCSWCWCNRYCSCHRSFICHSWVQHLDFPLNSWEP